MPRLISSCAFYIRSTLMKRYKLNLIVDTALLVLGSSTFATGMILGYILPPRSSRFGLRFLELPRHDWGSLHLYAALTLTVFVLVHLYLHLAFLRGAFNLHRTP